MTGKFDSYPVDGRFSDWKTSIDEKVSHYCHNREIRGPTFQIGKHVYSQMKDMVAAKRLEHWIDGSGTLSNYFARRALSPTLLGIIGFFCLLSIALICVLSITRARERLSKLSLGYFRTRSRPRCKDAIQTQKIGLTTTAVVIGICTITFSVLMFVLGSQMIIGVERTACDLWLELYGHFYGTADIKFGDDVSVVSLWDGSTKVIDQLTNLSPKTQYGDGNPVRKIAYDEYYTLKDQLGNISANLSEMAMNGNKLAVSHAELLAKAVIQLKEKHYSDVPRGPVYLQGLNRGLKGKTALLVAELPAVLADSWHAMEHLLEKYMGESSALLTNAASSVNDSLRTVKEIDAALAAMTKRSEKMIPLLESLMIILSTLGFILAIGYLAFPFFLGVIAWQFEKSARQDVFPGKSVRKRWKIAFILAGSLAVMSTLLCLVFLVAGTVGNDACEALKRGLFADHNWAILGEEVLNPTPFTNQMKTNMRIVLDTCIADSGDGNLALALNLQGRIDEVSAEVEIAKNDVRATRDLLLSRDERTARVRVIGFAFQEALKSQFRFEKKIEDKVDDFFYERTQMFTWDWKNYTIEGQNHLPSTVAFDNKGEQNSVSLVFKDEFEYKIGSLNEAMDFLNNRTQELKGKGMAGDKSFCSKLLEPWKGPCKSTMITDVTTNKEIDELVKSTLGVLDARNPANSEEARRMTRLIRDLRDHEFIGHLALTNELETTDKTKLKKPENVHCPENRASCSWNEARLEGVNQFAIWRDGLLAETQHMMHLVDHYVDDIVVEKMDSLVEEANNITDKANCQFEGTALKVAISPVCDSSVSGAAAMTIVCGAAALLLIFVSHYCWVWFHYMEDVAQFFEDSADKYAVPGFSPMSSRKEFVSYTGIPGSNNHQVNVFQAASQPSESS